MQIEELTPGCTKGKKEKEKQKGNPSEFKIPFGFLIVEGAVGEKTNFSFYIGGYCEAVRGGSGKSLLPSSPTAA